MTRRETVAWIRKYLLSHRGAERSDVRDAMRAAEVFPGDSIFWRSWEAKGVSESPRSVKGNTSHPMMEFGLRTAFDDQLRGSEESVRTKLEQYLGLLDLEPLSRLGSVVDIGCGRGEWLDILFDNHVSGYGVDPDHELVKRLRERGRDARRGKALGHLRGLDDGSLGLATMFHVAEHLPFKMLFDVFREAHRALAIGGAFVVETPNPLNVTVGSATFYNDPTHQRPVPPALLEFLGTSAGFGPVKMTSLNPATGTEFSVPVSLVEDEAMQDLVRRLNRSFFGPKDSVMIATKS